MCGTPHKQNPCSLQGLHLHPLIQIYSCWHVVEDLNKWTCKSTWLGRRFRKETQKSFHYKCVLSQFRVTFTLFAATLAVSVSLWPAKISINKPGWQKQLALHWVHSCNLVFQFLWLMLFPAPFTLNHACTRKERWDCWCPWFSKWWDLLMPSFLCTPLNQSLLLYWAVQTNFCTTFTRTYISVLIIFAFIQRKSLCAFCLLHREVRDQTGAGRDSLSCSKTL